LAPKTWPFRFWGENSGEIEQIKDNFTPHKLEKLLEFKISFIYSINYGRGMIERNPAIQNLPSIKIVLKITWFRLFPHQGKVQISR